MGLEEAILDKVRRLPLAEREQVLRFADGLQRGPVARPVPSRDRRREMDWIRENRSRFPNQWVVVDGDRLIAADADGHRSFAAARAAGIDVPFLVHVLPEDPLPFVPGWQVPLSLEFTVTCGLLLSDPSRVVLYRLAGTKGHMGSVPESFSSRDNVKA